MKINKIEKFIGSGFFSGFLPFAPGTFGSLVALLIYLIPGFENPFIMLLSISIFTVWGIRIGNVFEKVYGKDPSSCVIDEFVGTWISLLLIPKNILFIAIAFVIWRVLDIVKIYPANKIEKLSGGYGIMLDDIISGIYTLILIHLIINFL